MIALLWAMIATFPSDLAPMANQKQLEERQILALLTMAAGAIELIKKEHASAQDIQVKMVAESAIEAVRKYPIRGNIGPIKRLVKKKNWEWVRCGEDGAIEWNACTLATMASNIYEDLRGRIGSPSVVVMLSWLRDATAQISYRFAEREVDEHAHFAEADLMLDQMYGVLGINTFR